MIKFGEYEIEVRSVTVTYTIKNTKKDTIKYIHSMYTDEKIEVDVLGDNVFEAKTKVEVKGEHLK
jgi:hypothetical protein